MDCELIYLDRSCGTQLAAPRFFEPLLARLRAGQNPASALMEARVAWKSNGGRSKWVDDVMLFRGESE
jgi:hypothetical protein